MGLLWSHAELDEKMDFEIEFFLLEEIVDVSRAWASVFWRPNKTNGPPNVPITSPCRHADPCIRPG